jgi:hypothetical protein
MNERRRLYLVPPGSPRIRTFTTEDRQWLQQAMQQIQAIKASCTHVVVRSNLTSFENMAASFANSREDYIAMLSCLDIALQIIRSAGHVKTEELFRIRSTFSRRFR